MTYTFAIVVTPDFNAMTTAAFIDPFRAANHLHGEILYRWRFLSSSGGGIRASNGMSLNTKKITEVRDGEVQMGVVSSSWTPEMYYTDQLLIGRLRHWGHTGVTLCGLDTGTFILARAGQLQGRSATTHYEHPVPVKLRRAILFMGQHLAQPRPMASAMPLLPSRRNMGADR